MKLKWITANLEGLFILFLIVMLLITIFAYNHDLSRISEHYESNCDCTSPPKIKINLSDLQIYKEEIIWDFGPS